MSHGPKKQKAKGKLAEEVVAWYKANPTQAKDAFAVTAKDVIGLPSDIDTKLRP